MDSQGGLCVWKAGGGVGWGAELGTPPTGQATQKGLSRG